jgi:hypothetical protein
LGAEFLGPNFWGRKRDAKPLAEADINISLKKASKALKKLRK